MMLGASIDPVRKPEALLVARFLLGVAASDIVEVRNEAHRLVLHSATPAKLAMAVLFICEWVCFRKTVIK